MLFRRVRNVYGIELPYSVKLGRRVVIVANLKPRKLMGLESQGMLLAASDDTGLSVLGVDKDVEPGSPAK